VLRKTPLIRRGGVRNARSAKRSAKAVDLYEGAAFPKRPPRRNRKLKAWIAKQPCLVARLYPDAAGVQVCPLYKVHAAHVPTGTGGMGMKGDDLFVPLCFYHHIDVQHGRGVKTFERTYGVDLRVEAERYLREFEEAA